MILKQVNIINKMESFISAFGRGQQKKSAFDQFQFLRIFRIRQTNLKGQ